MTVESKGRDLFIIQKIVVALNGTIRLMQEIDVLIEQHGGWPGAFQTGEAQAKSTVARQPEIYEQILVPEERADDFRILAEFVAVLGG